MKVPLVPRGYAQAEMTMTVLLFPIRSLLATLAVVLSLLSGYAPAVASTPDFADAAAKATDIKPQDAINWQAFQAVEAADSTIEVSIRMQPIGPDWQVYTKNLSFAGPNGFTVAKIAPPPSKRFMDPITNAEVDVYSGGDFTVTLSGVPRWTAALMPITVTFVGCTNRICLFPYSQVLSVPFIAAPTLSLPIAVADQALSRTDASTLSPAPAGEVDFETKLAAQLGAGASLTLLMAIVFVGGVLSNLTPCVAPMVPITLRLLARQGSRHYTNAALYACGIVICYTALGLAAALSGGLFGSLLASKAFNIAFAAVMFLLAMTMLGFGDLSQLQALGSRLGSGKPSPLNTFMMGMGAGLVAAPCTGPILAALLAYTARSGTSVAASTALLGCYSCGFALPYVLLGGAVGHVTKIKVAPLLQLSVKLLFGSIMIALGWYYLRIPCYELAQAMRPHWHKLAISGLILGALISPVVLLSTKLQSSKWATLAPALLLGAGIFGSWQWLTTKTADTAADRLDWWHTEDNAFAAAQRSGKPVLIDLWAEWCEACKKMDVTTFADPNVRAELNANWVLLHLDLTESTPSNDAIQQRYGVQSLPTIVLLPPGGKLDPKEVISGFVSASSLLTTLRQHAHK